MAMRSAKALNAYINAKAELIRSFCMNFEAADQIATMGEFGKSQAEVELAAKINELKDKVAVFAEKAGKPELADAKFDESLVESLKSIELAPASAPAANALGAASDAASDANSTAGAVIAAAAAAGASLADAPAPGVDLSAERDALVAEVKAAIDSANAIPQEPVNKTTSQVKLLSKMPLLGATVIRQAESWDKTTGLYEVAMAVLWSPKLQEEAKGLATGNPVPSEKKGKFSSREWVKKQDLLAMVGPRRFTDKNGNSIVVGVAARDITGMSPSDMESAEGIADTEAMKYVATSLMCDLEAFREVSQNYAEYKDGSAEVTERIANTVASNTSLELNGVMKLDSTEGFHPLTGRKTYAVVYYLEPKMAKKAMERVKQLYADAITVANATKYKRGQLAGMEATYAAATNSMAKFEEGKAEAATDVAARVRAEEVKAKVSGPEGSSGTNKIGEKGGTLDGESLETVDLDF